ncbi:hypothetical protein CR513_22766, partial [Mucuna pruriens]
SSTDPLHDLDPEIEITLRRLRKARKIVVNNNNNINFVSSSDNSSPMENNDRTLKELATPDMVYQLWCIQYPQLEPSQTYELKSGLIHLRRSLKALKGIPCGLLHNEATRDTEGLYQNEGISIFLGYSCKGLAVSATSSLQHLGRHETHRPLGRIYVGQGNILERLYMNTRKDSTSYVPHVYIIKSYFYEGLTMMDRSMIDAASGGALMNGQDTNNN